jgi:hypothetical protein
LAGGPQRAVEVAQTLGHAVLIDLAFEDQEEGHDLDFEL